MRLRRRLGAVSLVWMAICGTATLGGSGALADGPAQPPPVLAHWQRLSNGKLPATATVTSLVSYQGRLYAAGDNFGGTTPCGQGIGCNPEVWSSTAGASWKPVLEVSPSTDAPGEQLLASPKRLMLFQSAMGTRLWVTNAGNKWVRVDLPSELSALTVTYAVFAHGRYVVLLSNRFSGTVNDAYGQSDQVWTSEDGMTWTRSGVGGPASRFTSVVATSSGFVMGGNSRSNGRSEIWASTSGRMWRSTAAPSGTGSVVLAATDGNVVAVQLKPQTSAPGGGIGQVSWRVAGSHWHKATGIGSSALIDETTGDGLVALANGFVLTANASGSLYFSSTGEAWSLVSNEGFFPKGAGTVEELAAAEGEGLIAVTYNPVSHRISVWRGSVG